MVNYFFGRKSSLVIFKRTKPGIGPEHRTTTARRLSTGRRLTQFGFGAISSGTLIHMSDPTYVD